jgi:16S rRNA (guanine527-N7)-methyltransferase
VSDEVSRETPPVPEVAAGVFSSGLEKAERYAALLADAGVVRGLIGPREVPRLWERHLLNCAVLERAIGQDLQVCDVGSGAGLPGIVLGICRPDLEVTLVEPLLRRTTFLEEAVSELGLDNVEVVRARAEELHGQREFDVVTSRAVAPLGRLVRWSMPLVRRGGELVAMKGASAEDEVATATKELRRFGAGEVRVERLGSDVVDPPTTVIRVEATQPSRIDLSERSSDASGANRKKRRARRGKGR